MTENQQPYEIKVGQHGKNCECSKCQPVKTTFCECETCQAHRAGKQESMKDRLKRFLEEAKGQDGELRCEDGSAYRGKAEWAEKQELKAEQAVELVRKAWEKKEIDETDAFIDECRRETEGGLDDQVNHPAHYTRAPVETIDIIRELIITAYGRDGFKAYCWGNEIKYRMRAGLKGEPVQDIEKAMMYMQFREEAK